MVRLHNEWDQLPFTFLLRSKICFLDNINNYLIISTVMANSSLYSSRILENSMIYLKKKKKAKNEGNFSYLLTWDVSNLPKAEPALLLQFMLSDSKTCQVLIYWLEWYPLGPLEQLLMIREMPAKENLAAFLLGAANADELCPQWWRAPHCQDLWLEYQARFLLSLLLPRYVNPITREGNWYKHEVRGRVGRKFHQGAKQRGK